MKKWVIKEDKNIADILIEIYGKNEQDLFQNVLQGFTSIIVDFKKLRVKEKFSFKMTADSLTELVFNFVEELIYLKDTKGLLFKKGKFLLKQNNKLTLTAVLFGEKISDKIPIKIDIKALTRHKFRVEKNKYYKATMVFDI
jgi:SHS2 domain-containing protein